MQLFIQRPWRRQSIFVGLLIGLILMGAAPARAAVKELANDSFTGSGPVVCQTGFVEGEAGAVKLTADPGDYPYKILKARMLICPGSTAGYIIFRISEDNTGTVLPGPILYEEVVQVTGSDDAYNELDLTLNNIFISSGSVRVEIEWMQDSSPTTPGLANDTDWYVSHVNYIYAELSPGVYQWFYAEDLGVTGDWIVRLEIETPTDDLIFADGFESGDTTAWSATSP